MENGKLIGYLAAAIFLVIVLEALLPYIVFGLVACGLWYLYQEYNRRK